MNIQILPFSFFFHLFLHFCFFFHLLLPFLSLKCWSSGISMTRLSFKFHTSSNSIHCCCLVLCSPTIEYRIETASSMKYKTAAKQKYRIKSMMTNTHGLQGQVTNFHLSVACNIVNKCIHRLHLCHHHEYIN